MNMCPNEKNTLLFLYKYPENCTYGLPRPLATVDFQERANEKLSFLRE